MADNYPQKDGNEERGPGGAGVVEEKKNRKGEKEREEEPKGEDTINAEIEWSEENNNNEEEGWDDSVIDSKEIIIFNKKEEESDSEDDKACTFDDEDTKIAPDYSKDAHLIPPDSRCWICIECGTYINVLQSTCWSCKNERSMSDMLIFAKPDEQQTLQEHMKQHENSEPCTLAHEFPKQTGDITFQESVINMFENPYSNYFWMANIPHQRHWRSSFSSHFPCCDLPPISLGCSKLSLHCNLQFVPPFTYIYKYMYTCGYIYLLFALLIFFFCLIAMIQKGPNWSQIIHPIAKRGLDIDSVTGMLATTNGAFICVWEVAGMHWQLAAEPLDLAPFSPSSQLKLRCYNNSIYILSHATYTINMYILHLQQQQKKKIVTETRSLTHVHTKKDQYFKEAQIVDFQIVDDLLLVQFSRWLGIYKLFDDHCVWILVKCCDILCTRFFFFYFFLFLRLKRP
ncbi:hypothetical protein RFI_16369 [Reticulomyxa filosa]|uniref:Uncharacterized protein n=1 Tax=Reticulomyxa filosa TaxID=46433 RepID=X6N3I5_RETFI|nr:hypothetical protein RFI_16369 [Reticulomyxa filosa]|eukprot:ETO20840.1 hypothetical protein RFI_16369 [Reticulomyxa filosa]